MLCVDGLPFSGRKSNKYNGADPKSASDLVADPYIVSRQTAVAVVLVPGLAVEITDRQTQLGGG
jgi:hypothetical protein